MKYEEMKNRIEKIELLRRELVDINDLINIKDFWKANIRLKTGLVPEVGEIALNNILPAGTVKTLALVRKAEIEKQIEELEK